MLLSMWQYFHGAVPSLQATRQPPISPARRAPQVQLVTEGDIVSDLSVVIEGEVEVIPATSEGSSTTSSNLASMPPVNRGVSRRGEGRGKERGKERVEPCGKGQGMERCALRSSTGVSHGGGE